MKRFCKYCSKIFRTERQGLKRGYGVFCSRACYYAEIKIPEIKQQMVLDDFFSGGDNSTGALAARHSLTKNQINNILDKHFKLRKMA